MKRHWLVLVPLVALAASDASVHAQKKPSCSDQPVQVLIYNNATDPVTGLVTPSALLSDGGGEYANGSVLATIHSCDGTNDMVLNVSSTKRSFVYEFPSPQAGSVIQSKPSWVPGTYALTGWIDVRNLLYATVPFTTHMGTTFTAPDRASYRLGFMPFAVDAPDLHQVDDNENMPAASSPAKIYPQAYDCKSGGATKPSWLVLGNNPSTDTGTMEVGTLYRTAIGNKASVHEGQYSMPFELRIDALACFAY